jgi:hypothetical protein
MSVGHVFIMGRMMIGKVNTENVISMISTVFAGTHAINGFP